MKYAIFHLDKLTALSNCRGNITQLSEEKKTSEIPSAKLVQKAGVYNHTDGTHENKNLGKSECF